MGHDRHIIKAPEYNLKTPAGMPPASQQDVVLVAGASGKICTII